MIPTKAAHRRTRKDLVEIHTPHKRPVVESAYYDGQYFKTMAPGKFHCFCESRGRALPSYALPSLALLKAKPGMRVLDIGCGRGEFVMYLAYHGLVAFGIDYADEALRIAESCRAFYDESVQRRIVFLRASADSLPLVGISFDRIMTWATLEHLYQWQWLSCLQKSFELLEDDGVMVIGTHPNAWYQNIAYHFVRPVKQLLLPRDLPGDLNSLEPEHVNVKSPRQLRDDLVRAGFKPRVFVTKRNEFEINHGLFKAVGRFLENVPVAKWFFRDGIVAVATKSPAAMKEYAQTDPRSVIGNS